MKIGPSDKPLANTPAAATPAAPAKSAGRTASGEPVGPATAGTQVALSPAAEALRQQASSEVFDAEKVERISTAIAEGRYQVNPGVIADKLIANARELLDRSKP